VWLADVTPAPDPLLQYGLLGLITAAALAGLRILYKRETDAHDADKARADRLEKEVERLNTVIQEQYVKALNDANEALKDAWTQMNRARRRGTPGHREEDTR
jgi:hypothetical protein